MHGLNPDPQHEQRAASFSVVCAGDSHTHASLSSDYVEMLRERFAGCGFAFINAGQNGNTCAELLRRCPEITLRKPDAVTALIGSNDVRTGFPESKEQAFERDLNTLVSNLRTGTGARIALLSIPPLGEDLAADVNRDVDQCNIVIGRVARQSGADYLPFGEQLMALISRSSVRQLLPFRLRPGLLLGAAFQHYVLRLSWNVISERRGFAIHTDQIHLNDHAGGIAADLIVAWLNSTFPRESAVTPVQR